MEDNFNEPDAPTSYPYLWDTPQHDYVEWNGSQANSHVGALARNVGEVIGVYGRVDTTPTTWLGVYDAGYPSTVRTDNLRAVEKKVARTAFTAVAGSFSCHRPGAGSAGQGAV